MGRNALARIWGLAVLCGMALAGCQTVPVTQRDFDGAQAALDAHIRTLASEEFGGRKPGTDGARRTENYLVEELQGYGFTGGAAEGEWRQPVRIVRYSPGPSQAVFTVGDRTRLYEGEEVIVAGAPQQLRDIPLIPVGKGDELGEGSLTGKAALVEVAEARRLFSAITAAEPKAIVLLAASDGEFSQYTDFLGRDRWELEDSENRAAPVVLVAPVAAQLLGAADQPMAMSLASDPVVDTVETANIIGKLPGRVANSGAVMVLAHWDHLGLCAPEGAEDRLCNGAVDNASGIGVMLETARRIAAQGGLDRDLYVMGTTAEELGLLGAEAFVQDPPFALPTIVAAFNIDSVAIAPRGASTTVVGWGRTPLDEGIRMVVEGLGRTFTVDEYTEQFVRRQDGWALLSRDVPTVLVSTSFGDAKAFNSFLGGPYHGVADEWSEGMELGGATDDIFTHIALLQYFGSVERYQPGERTEGSPAIEAGDR